MLLEKVWLLYLCISLSFFSAKRKTHDECGCLIRFRPSSSLVTNAAAQWKMHKCMSIPEIPKKLESTTFHRRPGSFSESFLSFILVNFCHKLVTLEKFPLQIRKLFKTHQRYLPLQNTNCILIRLDTFLENCNLRHMIKSDTFFFRFPEAYRVSTLQLSFDVFELGLPDNKHDFPLWS